MCSRPFILGNSIWVTTTAFMQLFNDMEVRVYDARYGGNVVRRIPVEVSLDTKEQIYYRLKHGSHEDTIANDTRLPKIGIQIDSIQPNIEKHTGKSHNRVLLRNIEDGEATEYHYDVQPIPYTFTYTVSVWTNYVEHWAQLMENILPHFDPYTTVSVKERGLDMERELKISLASVSPSSSFQQTIGGGERRIVRGELSFEVETTMYKAYTEDTSDIIHTSNIYVVDIASPLTSELITISGGSEVDVP